MSSKSAAATNSFLVPNAPTKKVQDYKQMKPTEAVSWVWDHFSTYDPKYNPKSQAVCNHCFLKYTKDPDGKTIDGDCSNWEISYGLSRSTSKLDDHLSFHHKEIYEAHSAMKAACWSFVRLRFSLLCGSLIN